MSIFSQSQKGQKAYSLPKGNHKLDEFVVPGEYRRKTKLTLPEISELDLTRHFSRLAHKNMGIDTNFYPLGSCTMKFNPRVNEVCAQLEPFSRSHPLAEDETVQGNLEIMDSLIEELCEVTGMKAGTVNPNAGAQGEFIGAGMIKAYHLERGEENRQEMIIPDSAHGTNPATASMAGFKTISVPTNRFGDIDLERLQQIVNKNTAGLMLTNPNTLGLFSTNIEQVAKVIHEAGGLLFYDGANLNPLLHIVKPAQMGFDVMHINLHKTFSTPHGGGGPGSGPVLCSERLEKYLPLPRVVKKQGHYVRSGEFPSSVGQIASFQGNFGIYLRAYVYFKMHGHYGLRQIAENAIINANYLKKHLSELFHSPYHRPCMHEFVIQADRFLDKGVRALDIAKRLLDYGIHAPTIYFPLTIKECMLIEPTETESKATLDHFLGIMKKIVSEILENPELVKAAPHNYPVSRLDEVQAVKNPILKAQDIRNEQESSQFATLSEPS